jgi:hypothetical protein
MGTKNPKISAYVPQEIFDRFQEFQEERNFSMSKAVIAILCDYFDIKRTTSGITLAQFQALAKRLEILEEKVEHGVVYQDAASVLPEPKRLEAELDAHPRLPFLESELSQPKSEPLHQELIETTSNISSVLSGKEFAKRLSISSSKLSTEKAGKSCEEFTEWSRKIDPDGLAWTYRGKQKGKGVEYLQVQ